LFNDHFSILHVYNIWIFWANTMYIKFYDWFTFFLNIKKFLSPTLTYTIYSIYASFLLLLCWGYIVAFTKVITIYQIYHTWIHPLHHFPLFSPPPIPGIVSKCKWIV
jgi:hypothetical protein